MFKTFKLQKNFEINLNDFSVATTLASIFANIKFLKISRTKKYITFTFAVS